MDDQIWPAGLEFDSAVDILSYWMDMEFPSTMYLHGIVTYIEYLQFFKNF